ncbi:MAG TPA: glycosyltransferase [Candidatus Hydrogenedentes bacterium]|nr:glycosyltransferase [Candidatus Hydrogenedentota bacterium]
MTATPEFSVIISCFNEENSIEEFHQRLSAALDALGRESEIIMVNDGSMDATWAKLKMLFEKDPRISVVMDLFSNAGQQAAVTAGMVEARGRAWVLLDSDLQLEPDELPRLVAEYDKGNDLVSGFRKNRKDSLLRVVPSKLANMIMRRASHSTLTDFGCTFKIYNADLLRAFNLGPLRIFNNVDAIAKAGRYTEVPVTHHPRKYGKSGWTFRKLWQYNMDNLVKLSQRPFQLLAGFCFLGGVLFMLRILLGFLTPGGILAEVTPGLVLNTVFFFSLMILSAIAILGEFAIRSFIMLQQNPAYIVRETLRRNRDDSGSAA